MESRQSLTLPWTLAEARLVLDANDASVEYSDEFVKPDGTRHHVPRLGAYHLSWAHGAMQLGFREAADAMRQAAVFVTLWNLGVRWNDADRAAYAIVRTWIVTDEGFDIREQEGA